MPIIGQSTGALTNAGHQLGIDTGEVNPLHLEEYGGEVETQFVKKSFMRSYIKVKPVRGTDTVTNDRMGKTQLQKVTPGVRPDSHAPQFDNISVRVDTMILARSNQHLLHDFQAHYDVRKELGMDHGKEIGKFFDEAMIIQGIKAASLVSGDGSGGTVKLPDGFLGGHVETLGAIGDESDPLKLQRAIEECAQVIEEKDVDLDGAVLIVSPAAYYTLLRNDKLIDADYSLGNGKYAKGKVFESVGIPIVKTNRIPKAAIVGHHLSNASNNNAYDVSAEEAKTVAIIMLPKALLAGETIPLTSEIFYDKVEKQWFVDSYLAFAATPNRAEHAAIIKKVTA